jgi:hypothetical protein
MAGANCCPPARAESESAHMFDLILTFVSFIFAIAATHLLTSATNLILARKRVIFSGPQALWMASSLLGLLGNWLSLAGLKQLPHWTPAIAMLLFTTTLVQYFCCSLLAMEVEKTGPVDMAGFFEAQRRVIVAALATLMLLAMIWNYAFRDFNGMAAAAWTEQNAIILATCPMLALAAFVRHQAVQWGAALAMLAMVLAFFVLFTFGG